MNDFNFTKAQEYSTIQSLLIDLPLRIKEMAALARALRDNLEIKQLQMQEIEDAITLEILADKQKYPNEQTRALALKQQLKQNDSYQKMLSESRLLLSEAGSAEADLEFLQLQLKSARRLMESLVLDKTIEWEIYSASCRCGCCSVPEVPDKAAL